MNESLVSYRPCNIAKLISAVQDISLEESYERCGLELCPICGKASTEDHLYPCCSDYHWKKHNQPTWTALICEECGIEYPKEISALAAQARWRERQDHETTQHTFCSNPCQGKWFGREHGFRNARPGTGPPTNRTSTHCTHGHVLEGSIYSDNRCKTCAKLAAQRSYTRKRNKATGVG